MAKKARRKQPQNKKWSRSNIINLALGTIVALSMVLSSVVVFGGAPVQAPALPSPTIISTVAPTSGAALAPGPTGTPTP